jgi:hypothetical protein
MLPDVWDSQMCGDETQCLLCLGTCSSPFWGSGVGLVIWSHFSQRPPATFSLEAAAPDLNHPCFLWPLVAITGNTCSRDGFCFARMKRNKQEMSLVVADHFCTGTFCFCHNSLSLYTPSYNLAIISTGFVCQTNSDCYPQMELGLELASEPLCSKPFLGVMTSIVTTS